MTDTELDALDEVYDTMMEVQRNPTGAWQAIQDQADAITTLRAQLAEAQKERNAVVATLVEISRWWAKEETRADRAEQRVATLEAALAAQIEADAGMIERIVTEARQEVGSIKLSKVDAAVVEMLSGIAKAIRNQPHDRTALDRYREKVLREAYDSLFKHPGFIHAISGQKFRAVKLEDAAEGILALIEKPE